MMKGSKCCFGRTWGAMNRRFSIYPNHHFKAEEVVNGKTYVMDREIHQYDRLVQAYLAKRWIKKSEIREFLRFPYNSNEFLPIAARSMEF